jgi:hypothetical protein
MRPLTAVETARPEVGVLVDVPPAQIPAVSSLLAAHNIQASFACAQAPTHAEVNSLTFGDQVVPLLRGGGLVRWLGTRDQLKDLVGSTGGRHHFLYASSGPSVGQWWLAHGAGGRLVAGAVRLDDGHDPVVSLRPGEVVEVRMTSQSDTASIIEKLAGELAAGHLSAVPVGRLVRDAGTSE